MTYPYSETLVVAAGGSIKYAHAMLKAEKEFANARDILEDEEHKTEKETL